MEDYIDISIMTKININTHYYTLNYLYLKNGSFLIYTYDEIILFHKNLSFKKIYSSYYANDSEKVEIIGIRKINDEKNLIFNYHNIYTFTIESKSKIKLAQAIHFSDSKKLFNVLVLKNGMIIGITNSEIIKINIEASDYNTICKIPEECIIKETHKGGYTRKYNIYELPNNNILIYSNLFGIYEIGEGRLKEARRLNLDKYTIFNINKCKVIHCFENLNESVESKFLLMPIILICKDNICISNYNYNNIYIYDIFNYKLLKKLEWANSDIFKFDEIQIFIINTKTKSYRLYYLEDIEYNRFQYLYFDKLLDSNILKIIKYSDTKLLVICIDSIYMIQIKE